MIFSLFLNFFWNYFYKKNTYEETFGLIKDPFIINKICRFALKNYTSIQDLQSLAYFYPQVAGNYTIQNNPDYYIFKSKDWIFQATRQGDKKTANYILQSIQDAYDSNWEEKYGKWESFHLQLLQQSIFGAAFAGHLDIVKEFVNLLDESNLSNAIDQTSGYAAQGGHLHIIQYCIERGANNWSFVFEGAARGNHPNLIKYFLNKMEKPISINIYISIFRGAVRGGNLHLLKHYLNLIKSRNITLMSGEWQYINTAMLFIPEKKQNSKIKRIILREMALLPRL